MSNFYASDHINMSELISYSYIYLSLMCNSIENKRNNSFKFLKKKNKFLLLQNKIKRHAKEISQTFDFKNFKIHQERISYVFQKHYVSASSLLKVHHIIILALSKMQILFTLSECFLSDKLSDTHLRQILNELRALNTIRVNKLNRDLIYYD